VKAVASADFNNDQYMDIAVANSINNTIVVHLNNGDKTFSTGQIVTRLATGASAVITADLNGDGLADLISASPSDNKIAWYANNGDGTFGSQRIVTAIATSTVSVYAIDMDRDGDIDLVTGSTSTNTYNMSVMWFENYGNSSFGPQRVVYQVGSVRSVAAADFDNDNDTDIVASFYDLNYLAWFENYNDGTWSDIKIISNNASYVTSIKIVDFNADGFKDVLVACYMNVSKVSWYMNTGIGSFSAELTISTSTNGTLAVDIGDLDLDGDNDVLSASFFDSKIARFTNGGGGSFSVQQIVTVSTKGATGVLAVDLDGDNDKDVLCVSYTDNKISWYENLYVPPTIIPTPAPTPAPTTEAALQTTNSSISFAGGSAYMSYAFALFSVDVNGDGLLDILAVSATNSTIAWYQNMGDMTFELHTINSTTAAKQNSNNINKQATNKQSFFDIFDGAYRRHLYKHFPSTSNNNNNNNNNNVNNYDYTPESASDGYTAIYASDLDNDGDADIIVCSFTENSVSYLFNNGDGTFGDENVLTTSAIGATAVIAADLTSDNLNDIIVASYSDNTVRWYMNLGGGNFGSESIISTNCGGASGLFAADLNADGYKDVLVASYLDGKVSWFQMYPDFTFSSENVVSTNVLGAKGVYVADINYDGLNDIIAAAMSSNQIIYFQNLGTGTFTGENVITSSSGGADSVFVADVNNDGIIDVLSGSRESNTIAWYANNGAGNFGAQQTISTNASGIASVYAADLDGDGDIDVMGAAYRADEIVWFRNLNSVNCSIEGANYFTPQFDASKSSMGANKIVIAVKFHNSALKVTPSFRGSSNTADSACNMNYKYFNRPNYRSNTTLSCNATLLAVLEGLDTNSLRQCGFTAVSTSSSSVVAYQTRFVLQVVEYAGTLRNMAFNRTMQYAMLFQINFAASVNANSSSVYVYGQATAQVTLTDIRINTNTYIVTAIMTSSVQRPYIFNDVGFDGANPLDGRWNMLIDNYPITGSNCSEALSDSTSCVQLWNITFTPEYPCEVGGVSDFNMENWPVSFTALCDPKRINCTGYPSPIYAYASFATSSSNFCPTLIASTTPSFDLSVYDGTNSIPQSYFVLGTKSFFRAVVTSPVNVDMIRVTKIQMLTGNQAGVSVLYRHDYVESAASAFWASTSGAVNNYPSYLTIEEVSNAASTGGTESAYNYFSIRWHNSISTASGSDPQDTILYVEARVKYTGTTGSEHDHVIRRVLALPSSSVSSSPPNSKAVYAYNNIFASDTSSPSSLGATASLQLVEEDGSDNNGGVVAQVNNNSNNNVSGLSGTTGIIVALMCVVIGVLIIVAVVIVRREKKESATENDVEGMESVALGFTGSSLTSVNSTAIEMTNVNNNNNDNNSNAMETVTE